MPDGEGNAPSSPPVPGAGQVSPPETRTPSSSGQAPEAPTEPGDGVPDEVKDAAALLRNHRILQESSRKDRAELTQLREAQKKAADAQLSEQERLAKEVAELKGRESTLQQALRSSAVRYQVAVSAQKLGIVDSDAAYLLMDQGALEFGDDGSPTNVDKVLTAMLKTRPYLQERPAGPPPVPGTTNGASRARGPEGARFYKASELLDSAFFQANFADIQRAMIEGRVLADQ